jgi:hypothetical protein
VPPSPARPGLIDRHDLVAALDHAAEKKMTIISAPAGSGKTSLLRAWAGRLGQGRIAFMMSVRPGQHDAQLFWLTLLGAVRDASGADRGAQPPPTTPGYNGSAKRTLHMRQRHIDDGGVEHDRPLRGVGYARLSSSTGMVRTPAVWRAYSAKPG